MPSALHELFNFIHEVHRLLNIYIRHLFFGLFTHLLSVSFTYRRARSMSILLTDRVPVPQPSINVSWINKLMNKWNKKGLPAKDLWLSSVKFSWFFHGSISGIHSCLIISTTTHLLPTLTALSLDHGSHIIILMWSLASSHSHPYSLLPPRASSSYTPIN